MERNEVTTAEKLKPGDRFYKASDKRRKALQLVEDTPRNVQYKPSKLLCCPTDIIDNKLIREGLKRSQYNVLAKNTVVVYLRNIKDND